MEFSFDFLTDFMSSMYEFFMTIATFLDLEPEFIMEEFTYTVPGYVTWRFYNPFTQANVNCELFSNPLLNSVLNWFIDSGYGALPLWQGILISLSTVFFIVLIFRIIKTAIDIL